MAEPLTNPTQTFPIERRSDRRRGPTTLTQAVFRRGRRKSFRRAGEGLNQYVDRPAARIVWLVVFCIVACGLDALLTLVHLDQGAAEANPFMALALDGGEGLFVVLKITITCLGVWMVAVHQNFKVGAYGLYVIAGGYAMLLAYHCLLFLR